MERELQRVALSQRERQVLELAASGHTDAGIALELGISEPTVGTYWGRVRTKLGPLNRAELVAHFVRRETLEVMSELRESNKVLRERLREAGDSGDGEMALYRGVIDHAADAILVVTPDGRIALANHAVEEVFGYASHEIEGDRLNRLIPSRLHDAHESHRQSFLEAPSKRRMGEHLSTVALRADGTEFPIAATLSVFERGERQFSVCVVRAVPGPGARL